MLWSTIYLFIFADSRGKYGGAHSWMKKFMIEKQKLGRRFCKNCPDGGRWLQGERPERVARGRSAGEGAEQSWAGTPATGTTGYELLPRLSPRPGARTVRPQRGSLPGEQILSPKSKQASLQHLRLEPEAQSPLDTRQFPRTPTGPSNF